MAEKSTKNSNEEVKASINEPRQVQLLIEKFMMVRRATDKFLIVREERPRGKKRGRKPRTESEKRLKEEAKRKEREAKKLEREVRRQEKKAERLLQNSRKRASADGPQKVRKPYKKKIIPAVNKWKERGIEIDELRNMVDSEEVKEDSDTEGKKGSPQKDSYTTETHPKKAAGSPKQKPPKKKPQKFVIETIVEKFPIIQELEPKQKPISREFAIRLSKAMIDKNRILSISLIQAKGLGKPRSKPQVKIQPKPNVKPLPKKHDTPLSEKPEKEPAKEPAKEPVNDLTNQLVKEQAEEQSKEIPEEPKKPVEPEEQKKPETVARILPTQPSFPLECKEHNHMHNSLCGHVLVLHDDHVDALHDGELHFTSNSIVYPHKLAVSKTNPDVCDPICHTEEENKRPLEEIVTAHVRPWNEE